MSNPRIEVDVVANVAGVASGVAAATSQLNNLGNAAQATAPKFEQLSKSTSRYNGIGLDFARVIQDAPFGIIGVGNNIQQLAQSFSSLGNAGDGTRTKIKLAFQQIFTSGNLLVLAVSAITTVLTLQEKGFFDSAEAAKELNKRLNDYRDNLQGIAKANLEGLKNAQSEIANFKLLQAQAENTNISYEKRIEAVEKLKKQYPDYLKNLTNEQILTGNVGGAYEKLTASIIATAKAKAFQGQIGQNAVDQATLAFQVEENLLKIKELQIEKANALATAEKYSARDKQDFLTKAEVIQKQINALEEQNKKNKEEVNKLESQNITLAEKVNEKVKQGADFVNDTGKGIDANKEKLKKYSEGWDEYNLQQETANLLGEKLNFTTKDYEKNIRDVLTAIPKKPIRIESDDEALQAFNDELYKTQMAAYNAEIELMKTSDAAFKFSDNLSKIENKEVKIKVDVEGFEGEKAGPTPWEIYIDSLAYAVDQLPTFEQRIADFAFAVSDILDNNLGAAFTDLGQSIGEALATGGNVLSAVGKSLLGSVGKLLGDFGKQLIAFGVAGLAYSSLIKSLFTDPVTAAPKAGLAIAAGVALVAISGAISSSMRSNSGGGGGGGSSVGSSGVGGGSSFVGGGAQGGMFAANRDLNGELVVRGQDLVYVFGQANNRINKG